MKNTYVFFNTCLGHRRQAIALLTGVMALGCGSAFAQSTGNATINVTGTIIGETCSVTTAHITLPIGDVDKSEFTGVGSTSNWSPDATLRWGACNASLITLAFNGTPDANNPNLFAVIGGAAGVGIQLRHALVEQDFYIPGGTASIVPNANGQTWTFRARYMQSDTTITTGTANAMITVLITYT